MLRLVKRFARRLRKYFSVKAKLFPLRLSLLGTSGAFKVIRKGQLDIGSLAAMVGECSHIIEVGANTGTDSLRMLDAFTEASLICFEPDPRALRAWRRSVKSPRAELREIAVSNCVGFVEFNQSGGLPPGTDPADFPDGWHLSGSILPPKNHTSVHSWSTFDMKLRVPCETLDYALQGIDFEDVDGLPIGLIWADVQGAERELIEGAQEVLKKTKFLYTEFSNDELYEGQVSLRSLLRMLPDFRVERIWTNDVLLKNRRVGKSNTDV